MPVFTAVLAVLRQGRSAAELKELAEAAAAEARGAGHDVRAQRVGVPGLSGEGLTAVLDFHASTSSADLLAGPLDALAGALAARGVLAETGAWTVVDPDDRG